MELRNTQEFLNASISSGILYSIGFVSDLLLPLEAVCQFPSAIQWKPKLKQLQTTKHYAVGAKHVQDCTVI